MAKLTNKQSWDELLSRINQVRTAWDLPAANSETVAEGTSVVADQWNTRLRAPLQTGALGNQGATLADIGENLEPTAPNTLLSQRSYNQADAAVRSKMCTTVCPNVCTSIAHKAHGSHASHSSHSNHSNHASHTAHASHSNHSNHGSHNSHNAHGALHGSHNSHNSHGAHTNHASHGSHSSHSNHTNHAAHTAHASHANHRNHNNTLVPQCNAVGVANW